MKYLYGDSTDSPLEFNFIQCLRDTVDFAIQVLQAEQQIQGESTRSAERRRSADAELAKVDALAGLVQRALEDAVRGTDSPSGRCASAIIKSAIDLSRSESERAKTAFAEVLGRLDGQIVKQRETCLKAFEKLLLKQDLVDSRATLVLMLRGTKFDGRLNIVSTYGVEAGLDLEVPATHAFAKQVRLEQFVAQFELETQESGWLSKETKLRPHRLDKYYLSELSIAPDHMTLKLRQGADGAGRGFDLKVRRQPPQALIYRVDDPPKAGEQPLEVKSADIAKYLALWDSLAAATADLQRSRKALTLATIDGRSLKDLDRPSLLVERIMAKTGPIVQEIARRSPSPNELVLKRLVGDDRREEIFLSKDELRKKLEALPAAQLRLMEPLGLFPPATGKADAPSNGTSVRPIEFRPVEDSASAAPADPAAAESPKAQAEVFHKRGIARMKVGEVAAAISDYDKAVQLRPDYAEAFANRAAARQLSGDVGGAVTDLETALKVAPSGWKHRERVEHLLEVARQKAKA